MFCAHLSHFGYAVQLLPEREEMSKPLLVLTLLKIISQYQWYISLLIWYLLSIVYLNISKRCCIESININHRIVLTIMQIARSWPITQSTATQLPEFLGFFSDFHKKTNRSELTLNKRSIWLVWFNDHYGGLRRFWLSVFVHLPLCPTRMFFL